MKNFIYTTQETDYGLHYETIETLHVETIGCLTVRTSSHSINSYEVKYSGNDASNTGALLEALLFINNARRNSKTLKIDSTTHGKDNTIVKDTYYENDRQGNSILFKW